MATSCGTGGLPALMDSQIQFPAQTPNFIEALGLSGAQAGLRFFWGNPAVQGRSNQTPFTGGTSTMQGARNEAAAFATRHLEGANYAFKATLTFDGDFVWHAQSRLFLLVPGAKCWFYARSFPMSVSFSRNCNITNSAPEQSKNPQS
ncbi:MAG TPA: hypothetical protein VGB45_10620 [Abditibacterium sp.]|jgi:hypothetical protein